MQTKSITLPSFGVFITLMLCLPALSQAQYAYDIVAAGYGDYSKAQGLNNLGEVVGSYFNPSSQSDHAYIYSNGQSRELFAATSFHEFSGANGINDNGQIALSNQSKSYIYDSRANTRIGLTPNDLSSAARAINQNGVIVGDADFGTGAGAYIFDPRVGVAQSLPRFANAYGKPSAYALNNSGDVVGDEGFTFGPNMIGDHAYIYHNGVGQDLGTLPGGFRAGASGINDDGDIVGYSDGAGISQAHAFLYRGGKMQDLETLYPTDSNSYAKGINNKGGIIGTSGNYPFVYHNGTMLNLRSMIDPNSGWQLQYASAINDNGQIAGYGLYNGVTTGFLLTPHAAATPAPGSLLTSCVGTSVMLLAARRRKRAAR